MKRVDQARGDEARETETRGDERRRMAALELGALALFDGVPVAVLTEIEPDLAWLSLPGGRVLFRAGDAADRLYLVRSGLVGVLVATADGGEEMIAEIRAGETVGEMAMIAGEAHSATVVALRDCELIALPKLSFDRLVALQPSVLVRLTSLLVRRLHRTTHRVPLAKGHGTVALVPADRHVPLDSLADALIEALRAEGRRVHRFGVEAADLEVDWFDEVEQQHDIVLYEAGPLDLSVSSEQESGPDRWTRFCLRQADRVVIVATPSSDLPDTVDRDAGEGIRPLRLDLVVLHPAAADRPVTPELGTLRPSAVHHLRAGRASDMRRLARHLTGRAVGLVLAGGAARGFAHIGAIRALREAGVPLDRIGGTSMGAIVGAGVACEWDDQELRERMHAAFVHSNPLDDWTVPLVALFKGETVSRRLSLHFGDARIEALWRPYFCVSTDLSQGRIHVHERGPLARALRASIAIPGVLPPIIEDGHVLVDGGIVDNFPVGVMARRGHGPIVGIDVTGANALTARANDRGTWQGIRSFLGPRHSTLPGIVTLLIRAGTVGSDLQLNLNRAQATLVVRPPLSHVPLLDWQSFDVAIEAGYRHTLERLEMADRPALGLG
ncbi:MAG TPA: patatin-like phospholipase family protein [Stellaceae bacterium]|nr:patatin-like phospholipase family protein [Stellaceae bacterium]